ncbi:hypothetical protein PROSTU_03035 [Providencia stuartii ATCC 25827]|uniref:Uncharacterized protein n=1 Tax=Providencia stuartii ATCC 25827 TaxID=471874 RepID=A0AA86YKJ8_PROST|nr:hypothetical protein PROSTU_03035 [Providencia stuartii ATCC 25827]
MLDQTIIIHIASIIEQWCTLTRRQRRANSVKGGLFQNYATQLYFLWVNSAKIIGLSQNPVKLNFNVTRW